ncbi:YraN family protein [Stappia sp. F7233]|uniref:UPF0102 protein H2509_16805 n=1 Tax=Stappia albiluteola TaxID=2758565 RepID=A0A839AJ45_9HYPH|nr:YraN family protein [Stappia albiluteola]MBA5778787.1 YraN family protein [Stappia albiluteola]
MAKRGRDAREKAYRAGLVAEGLAAFWLRLKGWRVLARRYRAPGGEIDIIARRKDVIAFVEVKARRDFDAALLAISPANQRRIAAASRSWLAANPKAAGRTYRFDAVLISPRRLPRHVENAFEAGGGSFLP